MEEGDGLVSRLRPLSFKNKHFINAFHNHLVLGARQNNFTIGSSPDTLSPREGLACETTCVPHQPHGS